MHLAKYDIDALRKRREEGSPPAILIVGRRGTGKSFLTRDILSKMRDVASGMVVSGTEEGNDFYHAFVPPLFIHSDVDLSMLENLVTLQREREKVSDKHHLIIVLDDCLYDPKFLKSSCLKGIFMNGRHWKIMIVICAQYLMDVPMYLRTQLDYVFLLRENNPQSVQRLYNNFGYFASNAQEFTDVLMIATEDHGCLVVDNVQNCIGYYKAVHPGEFRLFHRSVWEYSRAHTKKKKSHQKHMKSGVVIKS